MSFRASTRNGESVLERRYTALEGEVLLSGVQALVRLPMDQRRADIAAGMNTAGFVTGCPGSPLAGYDVELGPQRNRPAALAVVHQPAVNEELAATAVAGSQLASLQPGRTVEGVSALWYGKAPGLDRAGDAIRHGNLMGAGRQGGVLVSVGDDPQARSSSVPSTSEPTLYGPGLAVLSPADPQEILDLGRHGFALSRASGLWVGLRIPASVADASQTVQVGAGRVELVTPQVMLDGHLFVHQPSAQLLGATLIELERSLYGPRLEVARRYAAANGLNRITRRGRDDVLGIAAAGPAYLAVRHALRRLGLGDRELEAAGARLLKIAMPYPLDDDLVRAFATGLREIVVVEDKRGFLELLVKEALYGTTGAPSVVGKRDEQGRELIATTGEVDPDALVAVLAARIMRYRDVPALRQVATELARRQATNPLLPLPLARGPYFCSGCPHNTGVKVPPGAMVGSGSGCHGLAIQMNPRQTGNVVGRFQMGGEGAMWNGMAPFVSVDHFFQNLGDGTFAHSGSQSIRASVASGVDITYKLLANSVVAMTGGQSIAGGRRIADLAKQLLAEGVRKIIVTTDDPRSPAYSDLPPGVEVWHRRRVVAAQEALAAVSGVTVVIHDQGCAGELRRRRNRGMEASPTRRVFINPLVCDGCGDCGTVSNCVSVRPVDTPLGPSTQIHQESCNLDYACLDAECPALMTVEPVVPEHERPGPRTPAIDAATIPEPASRDDGQNFTMRITGIGGTGIVTTAQIVAAAAHLSGRSVRGLDQTGIAQKGGSVSSDLRIGWEPAVEPHRLATGECDLYLGCDLLVAAEPRHLSAASAERTVAVMSTASVPTGRQVTDRTIAPPSLVALKERVERRTRAAENLWIDASELSRRLFGSDMHANVLLLGAAYQHGIVPIDAGHLEEAIRLNGVAVDTNVQAFRYGRMAVADPEAGGAQFQPRPEPPPVDAAAGELLGLVGAAPGSELERIVRLRIHDLIGYQDAGYARRYADTVGRCRTAEEVRYGLPDGPFASTVAVQLHRLMAYKDEYEVARLHRDPTIRGDIEHLCGSGARIHYHLQPPQLRHLGLAHKVTTGRGADLAFQTLAAMRRLRGTALDPFGHAPLRRIERELRDEYLVLVTELCETLDPDGHARAVTVAGLPEMVRGYGRVKAAAVDRYRRRLAELGLSAVTTSSGMGGRTATF